MSDEADLLYEWADRLVKQRKENPQVTPDPKPVTEGGIGRKKPDRANRRRGRVTASRDDWSRLREQKIGPDGFCRCCFVTDRTDPLQLHHLIPRSRGGGDVASNLVPLCSYCHGEITRRNPAALQALARRLTDDEYAFVIDELGEGAMHRLFGVYHDARAQAGISEVDFEGAA